MKIKLHKTWHNILLIAFILCNSCIDNNYSKTTSTIKKRAVTESGSYIDTLYSQDYFSPFFINHRKEIFILIQDSVILKNNINSGLDTLGKISCQYLFKDFVVAKSFFIFNFSDELNYDSCFVYSFPEFEFQYGLSDKIAISDNYLDDVVFLSNRLKYDNYLDRLSKTQILVQFHYGT